SDLPRMVAMAFARRHVTGAGYIPRTWGKLEIDRLVAADSAGNKAKIIALSKSLYVMSPYTSLLVLENAEMYTRVNIDRGRKDHWALYVCPERIPVRTEPATPTEPRITVQRRPAKDVLESIVVRDANYVSGMVSKPGTAWDFVSGARRTVRPEPCFVDL